MYKTKIFDSENKLLDFINENWITDFSYNKYDFKLVLKKSIIQKINFFLSYKLN